VCLQYFDTVGWVLRPVKNRRPYNLYCVGGDVKPCSINQSIKANKVLGIVNRQFHNLDKASFLIFYKGFIRPHLEYAIQAWSPYLKKDIEYLEKVQRRATKLVKGIGSMPYSSLQTSWCIEAHNSGEAKIERRFDWSLQTINR